MTSTTAARELPQRRTLPWRARGWRRRALWPVALLAGAAAYFAIGVLWVRSQNARSLPSFDTYLYFYPNLLYALHSLRAGGGLLWNPYQDCGQPFFAISQTGLLYPINLVFAVLDRETALTLSVLLNLLVGGIGAFLLCRELRLGVVAALCGAIAFQLGGTTATLAAWSPIHLAPYVWMPVAMWRVERLLRQPSLANAAWLGIALTLQLLPGFPQIAVFTYQLILLRTVWALLGRELPRPLAALGAVGVGCALPFGLGAIQLLPSMEVARESLRNLPLGLQELGYSHTWADLRAALTFGGTHLAPPVTVVAVVMLSTVAVGLGPYRLVIFYLAITALYVVLSLGPNGALFPWYATLPLGGAFRMPQRFLWVCGFSMAVLAAFGAEALLRRADGPRSGGRWGPAVLLVVGAALFMAGAGCWPTSVGWTTIAALIAAGMLLGWRSGAWLPGGLVLLAVILEIAFMSRMVSIGLRSGESYYGDADGFALLRERLTPQDRIMLVPEHGDTDLMPKSASLFAVPSVLDYEPQVSRAYAEFVTWLRMGRSLRNLNDWIYPTAGPLPSGYSRRLLNLTAARFVLIARAAEPRTGRDPRWNVVAQNARWTIYENPTALPRARFIPRIQIVETARILPMLAGGAVKAAEVGLVEQPPDVPVAESADGRGTATVLVDEPERVAVQVDATAPGYLYLADQYAPGWRAHVNGAPAEILRANRAFRLVQVPAGRSEVIFSYRPRSFTVGWALSFITAAALLALALRGARRRRRAQPSPG